MSDLLLDLTEYLTTEGLAQGDGIDVWRDHRPEQPDFVIVLHEYSGGTVPLFEDMSQRSVQVSVRDKSAAVAKAKAWEIFKALLGSNLDESLLVNGRSCMLHFRQTPFKMFVDESKRVVWSFNLGVSTGLD